MDINKALIKMFSYPHSTYSQNNMVFVEQSGRLGLDLEHTYIVYNALHLEDEEIHNWSISERNRNYS